MEEWLKGTVDREQIQKLAEKKKMKQEDRKIVTARSSDVDPHWFQFNADPDPGQTLKSQKVEV
jgi:hypothetical protein